MAQEISVLFVCTGNICRSPMAEGILRHLLDSRGLSDRFRVDSAGTDDWHVGESPDPRSVRTAARRGVVLGGHARQVQPDDLRRFDYILAMDREHMAYLRRLQEAVGGKARLHLLREFDPQGGATAEVPDPYYGGPQGFENVFDMLERACRGFLDFLQNTDLSADP